MLTGERAAMGQDRAEALDDDKLDGEYPPEEPLAVEDYGTTDAEEHYGEPLDERVAREEPEVAVSGTAVPDASTVQLVEPGDGVRTSHDDGEALAAEVPRSEVFPDEDVVSGDPTRRDVATERGAPPPAEEAAVHDVGEAEG